MFLWSVDSTVKYIKTKQKNNKNLSGKYLTYNLEILMALNFASKAFAMFCFDVRFIVKAKVAYIFSFSELHKVGERVKHHENYIFLSTKKINWIKITRGQLRPGVI